MNALVIARLLGSLPISSCMVGKEAGDAVNLYLPSERHMDLDYMTGQQMEVMINSLTKAQKADLLKRTFGTEEDQEALMQIVQQDAVGERSEDNVTKKPHRKTMTVSESNEEKKNKTKTVKHKTVDKEETDETGEEPDEDDDEPIKPKWGFVVLSIVILFVSAYYVLPQAGVSKSDVTSWLMWLAGGLTVVFVAWNSIAGGEEK